MSTPPKDKPGQPGNYVRTKDILRAVPLKKEKKLRKLLDEIDRNKTGTVDSVKMAEMILSLRRQRFWLLLFLFMLLCFAATTIMSVVGIGYALVGAVQEAVKDTQVNLVDGNTVIGADEAFPAVGAGAGAGGRFAAGDKVEGVTIPPGGSPHFKAYGAGAGKGAGTQPQAVNTKNTPAYFFSRFMSFDSLMDMKYLFLSACVPDGADEEPACLRMKLTVRPKAP
ncbi:hypothetical protein GPECTOR_26g488 [Gonium pectorale]|uniref:EF-hand domain-containing protein n=1 Tax=Gonium pectorale TaxID=33097 RepID=A0A150GG57_GONPE|nr:hypothetical protein GPECTOR_26g488 [Gonium pectorale]|eukprot:KXZ48585.1 hypothetical protein GPECTOR_26g488 [Gonium pectorale]